MSRRSREADYKRATEALRRRVAQHVGSEFVFLNLQDLDGSWAGYSQMATESIAAASDVSDLMALDYFRQWLYEEMGTLLTQQFLSTSVPIDLNRVASVLRLKGPIEVKRLIEKGWKPEDAWLSALRQSVNVVQGMVHEQGQNTLNDLIGGHSYVLQGWRRIVAPTACVFCRKLTRTVWHPSDKWVKPHDKCGCTAEPVPNSFKVIREPTPDEAAYNQWARGVIAKRKRRATKRLAEAYPRPA